MNLVSENKNLLMFTPPTFSLDSRASTPPPSSSPRLMPRIPCPHPVRDYSFLIHSTTLFCSTPSTLPRVRGSRGRGTRPSLKRARPLPETSPCPVPGGEAVHRPRGLSDSSDPFSTLLARGRGRGSGNPDPLFEGHVC